MPELNCHFVSRFLTRPWEYEQRRLWYFDFDRGEVRWQSSETLFAAKGTNSPAVEERLNRIIETPLASARAKLANEVSDQQDQELPWPLFRALALLMMLQPLRTPDHPQRGEILEQTILHSDDELNQIASAAAQRYQLGRIAVRPDAPLLYASAGFFPLFARRSDDYWGAAIAIPISMRHVFGMKTRGHAADRVEKGSGRLLRRPSRAASACAAFPVAVPRARGYSRSTCQEPPLFDDCLSRILLRVSRRRLRSSGRAANAGSFLIFALSGMGNPGGVWSNRSVEASQ
jgi:hypothetical protein